MAIKNSQNQVPDTGHEWDGIRELTNPPPRWWTIAFYLSAVWVIVYLIIYPSIPLVTDHTKGVIGWTAIGEYKEAVAANDAIRKPYLDKLETMSAQDIINDPEMLNFANSSTKALFGDYCAACHGSNGQGIAGMFPVLLDDDWLYGGTVSDITTTIASGRKGNMPAHTGTLDDTQINLLTDFVIAAAAGSATQEGWDAYQAAGCFACHGADAKGNKWMGSANLTDGIWRFGSDREAVMNVIKHGVNQDGVDGTVDGVMPAFGDRLSTNDIKLLTVKVWSLGGGQSE
ncbi:MAG: cytochrome-c oxidase, cbb3-type subunit III [Gammaproteobacteria bacterium]|nr:cytochrome-c oxidase, cbb3-type subunit III [Gammaproteobacteria bacterium]